MELEDIVVQEHLSDFDYFGEVLEHIHGLVCQVRGSRLGLV